MKNIKYLLREKSPTNKMFLPKHVTERPYYTRLTGLGNMGTTGGTLWPIMDVWWNPHRHKNCYPAVNIGKLVRPNYGAKWPIESVHDGISFNLIKFFCPRLPFPYDTALVGWPRVGPVSQAIREDGTQDLKWNSA